jgi:uncharacterized protein
MKRLAAVLIAAFLAAFAAARAENASPPAKIQAHPALWHVTGAKGSAVLFGSVHILPENLDWNSTEIREAVAEADVLVFETQIDAATMKLVSDAVTTRGMLPEGQHLRDLLPPRSRKDFDHVLAKLQIPEAALSNKRPWLATMMIDMTMMQQMKQTTPGPDFVLAAEAQQKSRPVRYLEAPERQLAILAPDDPEIELQYLESSLKSFDEGEKEIADLTTAWSKGDVATIGALALSDFDDYPKLRAAFFDDRNRSWAKQIVAMLGEHKKFFITVGAGHLAGTAGLPVLLRAAGLKVEGP